MPNDTAAATPPTPNGMVVAAQRDVLGRSGLASKVRSDAECAPDAAGPNWPKLLEELLARERGPRLVAHQRGGRSDIRIRCSPRSG
jgi:hypothetical protein